VEDIVASLAPVESSWKDEHSEAVIRCVDSIVPKPSYSRRDLGRILHGDFEAGLTTCRLLIAMPKDEFLLALKKSLKGGGTGIKRFRTDREAFLSALVSLGVTQALRELVNRPVSWKDIIIERLRIGRGSAIMGQTRGRVLEDFVEEIVRRVFSRQGYDVRCRFVGARGSSTEKADFAIPSKEDPRILIEAKAYGATGSKQTDVLGDIGRITEEKRNDTHLLLVTDGITWTARLSDLRKLVDMQNVGLIARIYTRQMAEDLENDLLQLKRDHAI
jgi:hypothetical protein